jgi:hypothetical protein
MTIGISLHDYQWCLINALLLFTSEQSEFSSLQHSYALWGLRFLMARFTMIPSIIQLHSSGYLNRPQT